MPAGDGHGYGGRASPPLPFRKPPPPPNKPTHMRAPRGDLEALRQRHSDLFRQTAWGSRDEYESSKAMLLASPRMVRPPAPLGTDPARLAQFSHNAARQNSWAAGNSWTPAAAMPAPPPGKTLYKARMQREGNSPASPSAATVEAADPLPVRRHGSPEKWQPPPLRSGRPIADQPLSPPVGSERSRRGHRRRTVRLAG